LSSGDLALWLDGVVLLCISSGLEFSARGLGGLAVPPGLAQAGRVPRPPAGTPLQPGAATAPFEPAASTPGVSVDPVAVVDSALASSVLPWLFQWCCVLGPYLGRARRQHAETTGASRHSARARQQVRVCLPVPHVFVGWDRGSLASVLVMLDPPRVCVCVCPGAGGCGGCTAHTGAILCCRASRSRLHSVRPSHGRCRGGST
jgi:hypothetical protein